MITLTNARFNEKLLVKRVEKAVFDVLKQENFFVTDMTVADGDTIRALNKSARGVDAVTDVLSFPSFEKLVLPVKAANFSNADLDGRRVFLGSIMICRERAEEQAEQYGHTYARELGFLACHGLLHLLGFDHIDAEDEKKMLAAQRAVMEAAGLKR